LIDGTQDDVADAYKTVRRELSAYGAGLEDKRELVALNKCDALTEEDIAEKTKKLARAAKITKKSGNKVYAISGAAGSGITDLLRRALDIIGEARAAAKERDAAIAAASDVHIG
jgi:GTP-binding protein